MNAVLTSDHCRVRPLTEPIPKTLLGSSVADIFRYLVRMNDSNGHCPFKQAVSTILKSIDATQIADQSHKWAQVLIDEVGQKAASSYCSDFSFHLPVYVIASLLGVPHDTLHQIALWMSDFVPCLAPSSSPEQVKRGKEAADHLRDLFHSLLSSQQVGRSAGLLATLAEEAKQVGCEETEVIVANGIGFLSQAYEATAGLIGNTIVALASHRTVREQVRADPSLFRSVIKEVLRYDPPIQNTRRFLAQDGRVANQEMKEGDVVLVVLAAANRDPLANPNPEQFDIFRKDRHIFTFGAGPHICPGETLATMIASAGVEQLTASGVDLEQLARTVIYRSSVNARIALLATKEDA
ncbi:cytochrome P450 [Dictyobacter formicarum]|uniref:cytochrome P450 n=1 Tax=Dictyobacter formicarum TaxID=2778368 RepID=UPI001915F0B4|nr:cytochrome P450 [Dictyobacter formicarum]